MYPTTYREDDINLLRQLEESNKYRKIIEDATERYILEVSILWGIGSRESGWGLLLKPPGPEGTGDWTKRPRKTTFRLGNMPPDGLGFGRGLLQIDYDAHEFAREGNWLDAKENILYGAKLIFNNKKFVRKKVEINGDMLLRAAIAGYNCGCGWAIKCLQSKKDVDHYTSHQDYSKDVINRAGWFQLWGWGGE